jgi:glutathione S-transferase
VRLDPIAHVSRATSHLATTETTMKLYYAQGACSLAPHIALLEAGQTFDLEGVNLRSKQYKGGDFTKVNPKGYVPTLQLDDGQVLTEVQVILQYVADKKPEANLLPKPGTMERYRALEWLNFIATELHKGFAPLFNDKMPDEAKQFFKDKLGQRYDFLTQRLEGQQFLLGAQFSVADAYLFTVSSWAGHVGVDLGKYAPLKAYLERVGARPAVQKALKAEGLVK